MLNVKWGGIEYHFLSLWYDSTWDWTPVSRTIDEHSTHFANSLVRPSYSQLKKKEKKEKKRTCRIVDFAIYADHMVKPEVSEKKDKYRDLAKRTEKVMEHEKNGDTNSNWSARYSHQGIGTGSEGLGNKGTDEDHPNYSMVEIGQDDEKNPGDLRRLAVTQTPVENYQLRLGWKTLKRE